MTGRDGSDPVLYLRTTQGIVNHLFGSYRQTDRGADQKRQKTLYINANSQLWTSDPIVFQDLCRQRMQSKSSEKPEPLHTAASRVGSVSESQVRSPSSRSSTSSW